MPLPPINRYLLRKIGNTTNGRSEIRKCSILSAQSTMDEEIITEWSGLQTIVKIESIRIIKDKKITETRHNISNKNESNTLYFSHLVKGHWGTENNSSGVPLHWYLDSNRRCGYF